MTFELPSLPYANDALAPYMSSETLDFPSWQTSSNICNKFK